MTTVPTKLGLESWLERNPEQLGKHPWLAELVVEQPTGYYTVSSRKRRLLEDELPTKHYRYYPDPEGFKQIEHFWQELVPDLIKKELRWFRFSYGRSPTNIVSFIARRIREYRLFDDELKDLRRWNGYNGAPGLYENENARKIHNSFINDLINDRIRILAELCASVIPPGEIEPRKPDLLAKPCDYSRIEHQCLFSMGICCQKGCKLEPSSKPA